jgi:hypothetical protein
MALHLAAAKVLLVKASLMFLALDGRRVPQDVEIDRSACGTHYQGAVFQMGQRIPGTFRVVCGKEGK